MPFNPLSHDSFPSLPLCWLPTSSPRNVVYEVILPINFQGLPPLSSENSPVDSEIPPLRRTPPVVFQGLPLLTLKDFPLSSKSPPPILTAPGPLLSIFFLFFFSLYSFPYLDSNLVPPTLKRIPLTTTPHRMLLKTLISFRSIIPHWSQS